MTQIARLLAANEAYAGGRVTEDVLRSLALSTHVGGGAADPATPSRTRARPRTGLQAADHSGARGLARGAARLQPAEASRGGSIAMVDSGGARLCYGCRDTSE